MERKVIVFGGNGFVGRRVCEALLRQGAKTVSISRSIPPCAIDHKDMTYQKGDIFKPEDYREMLDGATAVVSCVGAFGNNKFMERINGDANILAIKEAKRAQVPHFVYLSSAPSTMPSAFLRGYYGGKLRTEAALVAEYPGSENGVALCPGFIYGSRQINATSSIPLQLIGAPLAWFVRITGLSRLSHLPWMSAALTLPVPVEAVGAVAAMCALRPTEIEGKVHDQLLVGEKIVELAALEAPVA